MVWRGGTNLNGKMKCWIYVTTQHEFIHQYIDAPEEVGYLRFPHRHLAHIKVQIEVFNDDREIEFILCKHWLDKELRLASYTDMSCEAVARYILKLVQEKYPGERDVIVEVNEDNENGAIVEYRKDE